MINRTSGFSNWLTRLFQFRLQFASGPPSVSIQTSPVALNRPDLHQLSFPEAALPKFVTDCRVAMKYLQLLGPLDWSNFQFREPGHPWPGPQPLDRAPFVAAYLVKLDQQKRYMSDLRTYLLEHPSLVWLLGFPLIPSPQYSWGFDVEASIPVTRLFLSALRRLDNWSLQFLLDSSVKIIRSELPVSADFGQTISVDTKHILAWVRENNPKVFIKEGRYDKTKQPIADPDCRLGVKKRSNQKKKQGPSATPTANPKPVKGTPISEIYWGYASGVAATKIPNWGEFVLAEFTQSFDKNDITYFYPLLTAVEQRLGFRPKYGAFDAAYDSFYVFEHFDEVGGFAAVPLSERGQVKRSFNEDGLPLCSAGLPMPLKSTFICRTTAVTHQRGRYACPLLYPHPTGQPCPVNHKNFKKQGCLVTMATCNGARLRYQIDRHSEAYKQVYNQRTATERINALAKELGIERPKLRNQRAITNQNTLIYILLNLRAIQRVRAEISRKADLQPN